MNLGRIASLLGGATSILLTTPLLMSPEPPLYQIIRGQYEDKIRRFSPPEKIFDVFATKNSNNQYRMNPQQLLKAICFYNYSELVDEEMENFDPRYLKKFLGKEDDYEIYDYFNFGRFVTFPRAQLKKFFKDKGVQRLDRNLFIELMLEKVCSDQKTFIKEAIGLESRQFRPTNKGFIEVINRQADSMFQGKESYTLHEFIDFRRQLMKELYTFEFRTFKRVSDYIDGVEFARSIIKYAENNQKRKLLRRVSTISPSIEEYRIKEGQYVNFHFMLQVRYRAFENLLQEKGALSKKDMKGILGQQGTISDAEVEVFFKLLDMDNSGFIEKRQLLGVIARLGYYWNTKSGDLSIGEMLSQRWKNFRGKVSRIQQILMEE